MKSKILAALLFAASISPVFAAGLGGGVSPVAVAPFNINANGNAGMASSSPVTIAGDQQTSSANATSPINVNSPSAVQILAHSGSKVTYVTHWFAITAGAVNLAYVYGTGTNCGTGQTALTGPIPLQVAGSGGSGGDGGFPVLVVPSGQDLCAKPDAAVQIGGYFDWQQR
jgi:hypothetical protein